MINNFLSIRESDEFLITNPEIHSALKAAIRYSITNKKLTFAKSDMAENYDQLSNAGFLINEIDNRFQLNYQSFPVGQALKEVAEETMSRDVPVHTIEALRFAENFAVEIRKPKTNHYWYSNLELQFETYLLIWLHQEHGIDISLFIDGITEEMETDYNFLRSLDITYKDVFPYLSDSVSKMHSTIIKMLGSERTRQAGLEAVQNLGKINPVKAEELYEYSKRNEGGNFRDLYSNLLIGLFHSDEPRYLKEAIELFKTDPFESLPALTWFNYKDKVQIEYAFHFLSEKNITEIDLLRNLPTFYIRLIDNAFAPEEIKKSCFKKIREFTTSEDRQLRGNLVWRTHMINGRDEEKYELLPDFLAWGDMSILGDYFDHFSSPKHLFDLIADSFLTHGLHANLKLLENALHTQYVLNRNAFGNELTRLLTSDLPILRYAGMMVMTSGSGGTYDIDLLKFDEKDQLSVIDTLLSVPINIEEMLPQVLKLRNSSFTAVLRKLEVRLVSLIEGYGKGIGEICVNYLDSSKPTEKRIVESLEKGLNEYNQKLEDKGKIREFNPFENEVNSIRYYYRIEAEMNAEQMELTQKQSVFAQMAKTTVIIRGNAYNTETNPTISPLQEIRFSRMIDRRYFINPDKYEYDFKVNATRNISQSPLSK